eukprot:4998017-Pleurochrysis_carterae.AAC.1
MSMLSWSRVYSRMDWRAHCRVGVGCRGTWVFEWQLKFSLPFVVRAMCTACEKVHALGKCARASGPGTSATRVATRAT